MQVSRILALVPFFALAACGTSQSSDTSSVAAAARAQVANVYSCSGSGLTVSYTTTSFIGQPTLSIAQAGIAALSSQGNQITTVRQGQLINLTAAKYIPDFAVLTWKIDLPVAAAGATVSANAQLTTSPTSFAGPQPRQHQTVQNFPIVCRASAAVF